MFKLPLPKFSVRNTNRRTRKSRTLRVEQLEGRLLLAVLLYDNGPFNGDAGNGNALSGGWFETDSFTLSEEAVFTSAKAALWSEKPAVPVSLQWSIGTTPFGSEVSSGFASLSNTFLGTGFRGHYDIYDSVFSIAGTATPGQYWFTLHSGVSTSGTLDWDVNFGPSTSFQKHSGPAIPIHGHSFQIYGDTLTSDVAATGLSIDTGIVNFGWSISGADLTADPDIKLYWSDNDTFEAGMDTEAYSLITAGDRAVGTYVGSVAVSDLQGSPASYLLLVADPHNVVRETDEPNAGDFGVNNVAGVLLTDLASTALTIINDDVFYSYSVSGSQLPADTTVALYWATGETFENATTLAAEPRTSEREVGQDHGGVILGSQLNPPPSGTTYLLFVTDPPSDSLPYGRIRELSEANNVYAIEVLRAPTIEIVLPTFLEFPVMGEPYELKVLVTNNAGVPISVDFDWEEFFVTVPRPIGEAGIDVDSPEGPEEVISLSPEEMGLLKLGTFEHTWEWISRTNPFTSNKAFLDILAGVFIDRRLDHLESLLRTSSSVATTITQVVDFIKEVGDALFDVKRSASVRYIVSGDYGPGSVNGQDDVTLYVPLKKQAFHLDSQALNLAAGTLFAGGIAAMAGLQWHIAVPLLVLGMGSLEGAREAYKQAVDPPDTDFMTFATARPLIVAELDELPESIWKKVAMTSLELQAVKAAEGKSRDRAMGAKAAYNILWESNQLIAAAGFAAQANVLAGNLSEMTALMQDFVVTELAPYANEVAPTLEADGLPELAVRFLAQLGWSAGEIESLRENLIELGPDPLLDLRPSSVALRASALVSSYTALEELVEGVEIRVEQLGQSVLEVTTEQRAALDAKRAAIEMRLAKRTASGVLLEDIEAYLGEGRRLLAETNNIPALRSDLDFGYSSLLAFQQFDTGSSGVQTLVESLENAGMITDDQVADALQATLGDIEIAIADGDYCAAGKLLGNFAEMVEAHRGGAIQAEAADELIMAASYFGDVFDGAPEAGVIGPDSGSSFQPRTVVISACDPSPFDEAAGFIYHVNWGDGFADSVPATPGNGEGTALDHIYTSTGTFVIRTTATDRDGAISTVVEHVIEIVAIDLQPDPLDPSRYMLVVGGTTGDDHIEIERSGHRHQLEVEIKSGRNRIEQSVTGALSRIVVYGGAGDCKRRRETVALGGGWRAE